MKRRLTKTGFDSSERQTQKEDHRGMGVWEVGHMGDLSCRAWKMVQSFYNREEGHSTVLENQETEEAGTKEKGATG